jgi:hypothetical protein
VAWISLFLLSLAFSSHKRLPLVRCAPVYHTMALAQFFASMFAGVFSTITRIIGAGLFIAINFMSLGVYLYTIFLMVS